MGITKNLAAMPLSIALVGCPHPNAPQPNLDIEEGVLSSTQSILNKPKKEGTQYSEEASLLTKMAEYFDNSYIVQEGDTYSTLASKYNMALEDFYKLQTLLGNSISKGYKLSIGMSLFVPRETSSLEDIEMMIVEIDKYFLSKRIGDLVKKKEWKAAEKLAGEIFSLYPNSPQYKGSITEYLGTFSLNGQYELTDTSASSVDPQTMFQVNCAEFVMALIKYGIPEKYWHKDLKGLLMKKGKDAWVLSSLLRSKLDFERALDLRKYFGNGYLVKGVSGLLPGKESDYINDLNTFHDELLELTENHVIALMIQYKYSNYKGRVIQHNSSQGKNNKAYNTHAGVVTGIGSNTFIASEIGAPSEYFETESKVRYDQPRDVMEFIGDYVQQRGNADYILQNGDGKRLYQRIKDYASQISLTINGEKLELEEELNKEGSKRLKILPTDIATFGGLELAHGMHEYTNKVDEPYNKANVQFLWELLVINDDFTITEMLKSKKLEEPDNISGLEKHLADIPKGHHFFLTFYENISSAMRDAILRYYFRGKYNLNLSQEEIGILEKIEKSNGYYSAKNSKGKRRKGHYRNWWKKDKIKEKYKKLHQLKEARISVILGEKSEKSAQISELFDLNNPLNQKIFSDTNKVSSGGEDMYMFYRLFDTFSIWNKLAGVSGKIANSSEVHQAIVLPGINVDSVGMSDNDYYQELEKIITEIESVNREYLGKRKEELISLAQHQPHADYVYINIFPGDTNATVLSQILSMLGEDISLGAYQKKMFYHKLEVYLLERGIDGVGLLNNIFEGEKGFLLPKSALRDIISETLKVGELPVVSVLSFHDAVNTGVSGGQESVKRVLDHTVTKEGYIHSGTIGKRMLLKIFREDVAALLIRNGVTYEEVQEIEAEYSGKIQSKYFEDLIVLFKKILGGSFGQHQTRFPNLFGEDTALSLWPNEQQILSSVEQTFKILLDPEIRKEIDVTSSDYQADLLLLHEIKDILIYTKMFRDDKSLQKFNALMEDIGEDFEDLRGVTAKKIHMLFKQLMRLDKGGQDNVIGYIFQTSLLAKKISSHEVNVFSWIHLSGGDLGEVLSHKESRESLEKIIVRVNNLPESSTLRALAENYILRVFEGVGEDISGKNYPKVRSKSMGGISYTKQETQSHLEKYKEIAKKMEKTPNLSLTDKKVLVELSSVIDDVLDSSMVSDSIFDLFQNEILLNFLKEKDFSTSILPELSEYSDKGFRNMIFGYSLHSSSRTPIPEGMYESMLMLIAGTAGLILSFLGGSLGTTFKLVGRRRKRKTKILSENI